MQDVIETTHRPGNLACTEVRELLSDIVDVRRGEIPHPDGTRLSEPGMRAAAELHLAGCEGCRGELAIMEETSAAFSDFSVGEPPAQHFANYGLKVRARMKRNEPGVISGAYALRANGTAFTENSKRRSWRTATIGFAISTLAAACVVFALSGNISFRTKNLNVALGVDKPSKQRLKILTPKTPPQMRVLTPGNFSVGNGVQTVGQEFIHNPDEPGALKELQADEERYGYFVFGEKTTGEDHPLLGVYLKTTRDEDRVVDSKIGLMVYYVVPGSPADLMGLKRNDYIVDFNGMGIVDGGAKDAVQFLSKIREVGAGKEVTIQIVRQMGQEHLFSIKRGVLGEYED